MDHCFGDGDFYENQSNPQKVAQFLDTALDYPAQHFDGALVWDTLEFLSGRCWKPWCGACTTCFARALTCWRCFTPRSAPRPSPPIPTGSPDRKTITLAPRGRRRPAQFFNNRSLEKLFQDFESVKFFLTRDHLREVIVRR